MTQTQDDVRTCVSFGFIDKSTVYVYCTHIYIDVDFTQETCTFTVTENTHPV